MPGHARNNNEAAVQQSGSGPPLAGAGVTATAEHLEALRETEEHSVQCVPDYRNRQKKMIAFWKAHYPAYYEQVVYNLSAEQRSDRRRYHTSTQDVRYDRLNPKFMKYFLSGDVKIKADGKHYSFDHIRKFHDAVLHGAKVAEEVLSPLYLSQMKAYLKTLKKEKAKAKSNGNVDEQEADGIPFVLMAAICKWALTTGNLMVWCFTIIQWNVMGRSINVDLLGFHNFKHDGGNDSIVITYD